MRKRLLLVGLLAILCSLAWTAAASAHPLGNFTINRFSRIEVSGHRVYVLYVLDMAEIPTFQAGHIDQRAYARRLARGAHLSIDGKPVQLVPGPTALAHPPGAAHLPTTRLEVLLAGPQIGGSARIAYHDTNYASRIGWKEIVVGRNTHSTSDELRAYPKSMLQSPLDITSVQATVAPTSDPVPALASGKSLEAPDRVADAGFAKLVGQRHLGIWVVLASLAAAIFWGAAHALSPGHGKSIVTAYLVGQRGTPWHAALLGLIVTATHTIGVFTLGFVTLALSQFIVPDHLYPWLNLASGVLVVTIGASVLSSRWRHARAHAHGHEHHHHHAAAEGKGTPSYRSLFAVGVSGGMLPCPSALVVLLAAISLHRVVFGLVLIVAFSAGLALSITGVGLVAVLARRVFSRARFDGGLIRALPALSAAAILLAGLVMTLHAIPKVT
jgi:ABC-type nickel/cobalt efflux system permease component RcnA